MYIHLFIYNYSYIYVSIYVVFSTKRNQSDLKREKKADEIHKNEWDTRVDGVRQSATQKERLESVTRERLGNYWKSGQQILN